MATKVELLAKVSEKVEGITKKDIEAVLSAYGEVVKELLVTGEEVPVVGIGKFAVVEKAERKGRNPKTSEEIVIPAHKAPKFKFGKEIKDIVK